MAELIAKLDIIVNCHQI